MGNTSSIMIIDRYITKEILATAAAVTGVLVLIAMSNRFVAYLAKAAVGQMPAGLILQVMGLYIPEFIVLLAPLGLFIGILLAHGRMHADSEMTILLTSGFSWAKLLTNALKLAWIISLMSLVLTLWLVPKLVEQREEMFAQGEAAGIMQAITPGQFQTFNDGQVVFYVEDLQHDNKLAKIFIADQSSAEQATTITAQFGYLEKTADDQKYFLILKDGHRYTGKPGAANYTVVDFIEYGREIKLETAATQDIDRMKPSSQLWHSRNSNDQAELQWRLSMPLSALILTLIAVPMARVSPRQGRFAKFLPALVIYIGYYNLMSMAKRLLGSGSLPSIVGMWWVHALFLLLGMVILAQTSGRLHQVLKRSLK